MAIDVKHMPSEVVFLLTAASYNIPVGGSLYWGAKEKYPQYWNNIGEFDPFMQRRNRVINYFRKAYRDYKIKKRKPLWQ